MTKSQSIATKFVAGRIGGHTMGRLTGKVAMVTGAARGMGRAHAVALAREGARVLICDLPPDADFASVEYDLAGGGELDETAEQVRALGGEAITAHADVRSEGELRALVDAGLERWSRVDILVANAGITGYAPAHKLTEEAWDEILDVNLKGAWLSAKVVIPSLIEQGDGGSLVFISSGLGLKGLPEAGHYAAAKHGVVGLMRSLALELAPHWIRSNTIHPAGSRTPMAHNPMHFKRFAGGREGAKLEDVIEAYESIAALPIPWTEPEDIANAVVWLASDEARYVTGVCLPVDGGWSVK
jgi:SDR family mycofactocin-dependent oxidoreductase